MKSQQTHSGAPDVRIDNPKEQHTKPEVYHHTHRKLQRAQHDHSGHGTRQSEHVTGLRASGSRAHTAGATTTTVTQGPTYPVSYASGPDDRCRTRSTKSGVPSSKKLLIPQDIVGRTKHRTSTSRPAYFPAESGIRYASPPESVTTTTSTNTATTMTTTSTTESHEQEKHCQLADQHYDDPVFGRMVVLLVKGEHTTLGLTVAESTDLGEPPVIASIHPGSLADKSDQLLVGDRLISVETVYKRQTEESGVTGKTVTGPWIRLEVEYELPDFPPAGCAVKHISIDLDTRGRGVGLVLRGGWNRVPSQIRPLTVMRVREDSIAELDGRIKPGDRIVTINNVQTARLTCEEAVKLLDASKARARLTVEYNVANFEKDRNVSGAVMVEIEKPGNEDLGISLAPCHEVKTGQNAFFINFLRQGSIADRCGALFVGDRVEAIDDIHVEDLSLQEAMRRLKHNGLDRVRLQIVPGAISTTDHQSRLAQARESNRRSLPLTGIQPPGWNSTTQNQSTKSGSKTLPRKVESVSASASAANTPCGCDHGTGYTLMEFTPDETDAYPMGDYNPLVHRRGISKSFTSLHSLLTSGTDLCRCEEVEVCLEPDEYKGYGLRLCAAPHGVTHEAQLIKFPVVDHVEPGGAAYKSGVIQEGDRVITMNGQTTLNRTIEELTEAFLNPEPGRRKPLRLTLVTQYSVADNIIPTAGVFDVKLVRRSASLGINLQASIKKQDGQPLLISKVIPGSVASRSGSICPGDILLAVNGVHLASCSLSEAIRLLQASEEEIVTLRVQKLVPTKPILNSDDPLVCSNPDTSKLLLRPVEVPESQLTQLLPTQEPRSAEEGSSPPEIALTRKALETPITPTTRGRTRREDRVYITRRSTSSDQDDLQVTDVRDSNKQVTRVIHQAPSASIVSEEGNRKKNMPGPQHLPQSSVVDARRRLMSSPENLSHDEGVSVVRVVLRRKSADYPWGIIICGTDEALDAPVFIDSLSPGDPGAVSGLLFPGDRILAINGSALHAGNTLTQAMRMLQTYADRVVLHVARPSSVEEEDSAKFAPGTGSHSLEEVHKGQRTPDSGSQRGTELSRRLSLKKVVATSNFSRSFDSATNSLEFGGEQTGVVSENIIAQAPQDDTSFSSAIPLGSKWVRSKVTTGARASQGNATVGQQQKIHEYSGIGSPANRRAGNAILNSQWSDHGVSSKPCVSDGHMRKMTTPKSSPKLTSPGTHEGSSLALATTSKPLTISARSSSQNLVQWMQQGQEDVEVESDASKSNERELATETGDHHEFYTDFAGYNEVDLESIQCPGCREAVANELRQQRQQQHRTRVRMHQTRSRTDPVRQRARSYQRSHPTVTASKVDEDAQALEVSATVHNQRAPQIPGSERHTRQPSDHITTRYSSSRPHERGVWCVWIRLTKASATDSYGIGISEGISTRGIFVSAIRPNSTADRSGQLHLYDRILMINDSMVEGLSCSEAVALISRSERCLDLLVQRRINHPKRRPRDAIAQDDLCPKAEVAYTTRPHAARATSSAGKKAHKRTPQTNLTLL